MENRYETVCIVKPDVGDEVVKAIIQKATATLETGGGKLGKLEEWGRRRLAYTIQKKHEGYYFLIEYSSSPDTSKEVGRQLKINEDVLRFQTIRLEEQAENVEAAKVAEGGQA